MKHSLLLCPLLLIIACGDDSQHDEHHIAYGSVATIELSAYESCGTFNFDSSCGDHAIALNPNAIDIDTPETIAVGETSQTGTLQVEGLRAGAGDVRFETDLGDVVWQVSVKEVGASTYVFFPLDEDNPKRVAYMAGTTMHVHATYHTQDRRQRLLGRFDTPWMSITEASLWTPLSARFAINRYRTYNDSKLTIVNTTSDQLTSALDHTLLNSIKVPQRTGQYTMKARGSGEETLIDVVDERAITDIVPCDRPTVVDDQFCLDFLVDQTVLMAGKPTVEIHVINDRACEVKSTYDEHEQRWRWSVNAREFVDDDNLTCTFDVTIPNATRPVVRGFEAQINYGRVDRVMAQSL